MLPSGLRIWMRSAPPTRASISQTGLVKPFGPHHCASCLASVHALNTSARGASKTRVILISRSASALVWAAAVMIGSFLLPGALAIDHPRSAELVDQHAEALRPKSLLDRHAHVSIFGKRTENAVGLGRLVDAERDLDAFHRFIHLRRRVRAHQELVAHGKPRMHDLVPGFRRGLCRHWALAVFHHHDAFAVERQIRIHLHVTLRLVGMVCLAWFGWHGLVSMPPYAGPA